MGAAQFTPGPWEVRTDHRWGHDRMVQTWYIHTPANRIGIASQPAFSDDTNAEANARLIAAAPELYEALETLWAAFEKAAGLLGPCPLPKDELIAACGKTTEALSKARGDQ